MIFTLTNTTINIGNIPYSSELIPKLIDYINQNAIETISISGVTLPLNEWKDLLAALKNKITLNTVNLSGIELSNNFIEELFQIVNLRQLALTSCHFLDGSFDQLCNSLDTSQLVSLNISRSPIKEKGIEILAPYVMRSKTLKHLNISNCDINFLFDVVFVEERFKKSIGDDDDLKFNYKSDVKIGTRLQFLTTLLSSSLESLDLSGNKLLSTRKFLFHNVKHDAYSYYEENYFKVYTREYLKELLPSTDFFSGFSTLFSDVRVIKDQICIDNFVEAFRNNSTVTQLNISDTHIPLDQIKKINKNNIKPLIIIAGTAASPYSFNLGSAPMPVAMMNFLNQPLDRPPAYGVVFGQANQAAQTFAPGPSTYAKPS